MTLHLEKKTNAKRSEKDYQYQRFLFKTETCMMMPGMLCNGAIRGIIFIILKKALRQEGCICQPLLSVLF